MSNGGRLRKQAVRAKGVPVSAKEKLVVLVNGLAGMVNAIEAYPDEITPASLSQMAEHLLGIVGFKLSKKEASDVGNTKES